MILLSFQRLTPPAPSSPVGSLEHSLIDSRLFSSFLFFLQLFIFSAKITRSSYSIIP